jgi:hypothetical protein
MADGHWIRKKGGGWFIAVPREVRDFLAVTHRMRLYWQVRRHGEAVLASSRKPKEGQPPIAALARELAAVRLELEGVRTRDALRDRGMYAEGYAHGYAQAYARALLPHGRSAKEGRRREVWARVFPVGFAEAYLEQPERLPASTTPRMNARRRRSLRETLAVEPSLSPVAPAVLNQNAAAVPASAT